MAGQPLAEAYVRIDLDTREFEKGLAGSKVAFAATADSIQNSARQLSAGVMAAFAGIAAAAASLKKVTQSATEFDRSMREVWTLMNVSEKEMRELASQVEELGVRYGQTGAKSLKAFYQIVSASFSGAEGMKVLDVAMKSAVAGITDVYTSADALTSILNAYRMSADEAEHVSDVMFQTVKRGKTTMGELSATIGRLTGIAAPAGVSIEELGAAIAALTRGGLATDEAVTALRAAIVELQKPSEALQAIIQDLGYETGTAAIKAEGFFPLLRKIAEKAEEAGIPLTDLFGNIRSLTAVLPLAGDQAEAVAEDLEAMRNAAGSTDEAFRKMAEGVSFQMQQLSAAFDQLSTKIGSLVIPVFLDLMNDVLNPFIDTLRWAAEGLQSVINVSVGVTGLEDAEASFAEFTAGLERMLTTGLLAWAMKAFGGKVSPLAGRIGFSIPLVIQFLTEIRYAIEKPEFGPLISELYRALEEAFPGALIGGLLFGLPGAVAGAAVSILIPTIIRFEINVQTALEKQQAELGKTFEQALTLEVEVEPKLPEVETLSPALVEIGITDMLNQVRTAITEWTQGRMSLQKAASQAASIVSQAMANMGLKFRDLVPWLYQEFKEVPAAFWEAWLSEMGTSVAEFTTLLAQQAKKVTPKVEVEAPQISLPGFAAPEAPQAPITLPGFAPAEVPSLVDIIRQYQAAQSQATSAAEGEAQSSEQASNAAQKAASAVEVWARQVKAGTLSVADFLDKVRQAAQAQGVTAEKLIEYYAVVAELYNWFQDLGEAQAAFFGSSEKAKAAADLLADFLGIEVEKRKQATDAFTKELEKITQPSAEAARKLLELARNATPEQLIQLNQKFRALLQTGKELYEAQSIYGGATAQVTENLRAFLQVLGFGPAKVEDILVSLGMLEQAGPSLAEQLEKLKVPTGATGAALASLARQAGGDSLALKEIYDKAQSLIQLAPQLIKAYEFFGLSTEKVTENLKQFLSNLGLAPEKINDILVSLGLLKTPLEEFKDRLAALREPSAETGQQLASLIPEASQFQGGLVELHGKTQALISAAKEEYEARKFFGLATEQLTEQLRAFLNELGLAPDQINDIITKIVGAGEDLTRTLNALVSQAEALTLAQADQVLALREQALAILKSGQVTDKEGNVREATIGELLAAASAVQSFSTWLDSGIAVLERLVANGEAELQPLLERFRQLKESTALGPTLEEQRRALLESIKVPSAEAGEKLRQLALESAGSAEDLIAIHAKAQDLISVAKQLYEAQSFFNLSTEETISGLRAFLASLGLSEDQIESIVEQIVGEGENLASAFNALVSQAEALTLAQADQILALREQALAVLESGKVVTEEGEVRQATIGEILAAASAVSSFASWLDAAITVLERLITAGDEAVRPLYEQLVKLKGEMALGPTFEEQRRAQEEARRAAERAAEEARRRQEELARKIREAWEESFKSPAKKALESGEWLKAALAIREIARRKDDLIAEARTLPAVQGKTVELAKVYDLIIGGQRELLSNLDKAIKVLQIAGEDATKLEELKARIEELFDPLGEWKRALREAVKATEEAPMGAGLKLRELFLKAKGFQKGGVVTGPTLALLGEAGPEAVIPLTEGGVVGGVPGEVVCTEDYCAAVQTASDALSGFAKTSSSAMDLFAEHINALREVDPEFARRFTKPLASGCMACAKAAEGLTGELTSAAQGSKVIAEILEDKFWNALEDVRGELVPSAEAASLVADKAREQIQAYESLIEDMELFGLDTRDVRRELEEFKAGLRGLSPELARLADALEDLSSKLIDALVGAAFDLIESLFSLEGAASEAYSALNVPAGFKGARYEWAAAKPGEPYRPVEETGEGITDFLKRVVQTFLGWLEEQVSGFLNDLLAGFSWENFVSRLDWGAFVSFLGWDNFLSWLNWGDWVGALDWNRFVSILDWHRWVNPLEWPSLLGDIAGSLVAFINSEIQTLFGWLENMLGPVLGPIVGALGEFLQGLVTTVGALLMLGTTLGLVEGVAAIVVGALQGIGDLINAFLTPISEELGRSWEKLTPLIDATRQLFASLSPVFRELGEVVAMGISLMTDLFAALAPLFSAVAKIVGAFAEALAPAIRAVAKLFEIALAPVVAVLAGGLKALAWVVDLLGSVIEGVVNSIKWVFNIFIGALNLFVDAVNALFGWAGVQLEHLPYLQRGGVVTRPTLAWLGEAGPEAVIPLTGFSYPRLGLAAAGASISIEVEGRLVGDGRELVGVIERVRARDEIVRGKR